MTREAAHGDSKAREFRLTLFSRSSRRTPGSSLKLDTDAGLDPDFRRDERIGGERKNDQSASTPFVSAGMGTIAKTSSPHSQTMIF
jgi:hypothetical protein